MKPHRANPRDANEPELIELARTLGAKPIMTPPLDWLVWVARQNRWVPCEIKTPERQGLQHEYTRLQKIFIKFCDENNAPYFVWRSTGDVIRDLGGRIAA